MHPWKTIHDAPRDGRPVYVRRDWNGETLVEGWAEWRSVTFPAYADRHGIDPAFTDAGWMREGKDKRFPEPTHWSPEQPHA